MSVCTFVKDPFLPFWGLFVCTSHTSTPSFLGFGRLYFSNINSFLFRAWLSVLLKYQLLPFWGLIARCPSVPHVPPATPWAGMYSAKRAGMYSAKGAGKYSATTLIGLPALRWIQAPVVGPECGNAPTWAGMIPASFPLLGRDVPGHTLTPALLGL